MGLIISLSQADQRKTFYVLNVHAYTRLGVPKGHLPAQVICALALPQAKANGCDEICVCPDGMLPRKFRVDAIEKLVRENPEKFRGWIPRLPQTPAEHKRNAMLQRINQQQRGAIIALP